MRRVIPVLFLLFGIGTPLIWDTAEAHGRRRCRPRCVVCCETYVVTSKVCPKYKMMTMGSLSHYYATQHASDCSNSTPVSYDTTDGTISTDCVCEEPNSCCISMNYIWCDSWGKVLAKPGHHVRAHDIPWGHKVPSIPAEDSIEMHYTRYAGTSLVAQFIVRVGNNNAGAWWLKVGQYRYTGLSATMDNFVGYEVIAPADGGFDVSVLPNAVTNIPRLDHFKTLTIAGEGAAYDGQYQVVRAR